MAHQPDLQATPLDPRVAARVGGLELVARTVVDGFLRGLHRSAKKGSSVEFSEYRPYVAGDDSARVDWRAYGRTDRLYLKSYEDETNLRATFVLDCSASMAFGAELTKFRYASCLAACLGLLMVRQQDAVGLMTSGVGLGRAIAPKASAAHHSGILSEIERLRPAGGTDLGSTLQTVADALKTRGWVVVLSDLLDDPERILSGLARLRFRGTEVLVFHILDPAEREFPFSRWTVFRDPEAPRARLKLDARWVREAYRRNLARHVEKLRRGCRAANIDYELLDTRTPFDAALARYLARRRVRAK